MRFKTVDIKGLTAKTVAELRREVAREFRHMVGSPDWNVEVEQSGQDLTIVVEHVDLMDPTTARWDLDVLLGIVRKHDHCRVIDGKVSARPSFADFRRGAMPSIWVRFAVHP